MIYAILAVLCAILTVEVTIGIIIMWQLWREVGWIKAVLVPWMANSRSPNRDP